MTDVRSINDILKYKPTGSAIKKKEPSKVKLIVRDIENTTWKSRSPKVRKVRKKQKKLEVLENGASLTQPKLEHFFSKETTRQSTLKEDWEKEAGHFVIFERFKCASTACAMFYSQF